MTTLDKFRISWEKNFPLITPSTSKLLIAFSGGADSMALTDMVSRCGFQFRLAHCNFHLRGVESDRDEVFVRQISRRYGVPLDVRSFSTMAYCQSHGLSVEEGARKLRYDWFQELLQQWSTGVEIVYLLTAHHADDNLETVLMHWLRGAGLDGFCGIDPFRTDIPLLRPLLPFSRQELRVYLEGRRLSFVEDSSNEKTEYFRNYLRHKVIPELKDSCLGSEKNLFSGIERLRESRWFFDRSVQELIGKILHPLSSYSHCKSIDLELLFQLPTWKTLLWEILRPCGFSSQQLSEVCRLREAPKGKWVSSRTYRIWKDEGMLILSPNPSDINMPGLIHDDLENGQILGTGFNIRWTRSKLKKIKDLEMKDPKKATLDTADIQFPLLLRTWKEGDFFIPFGMFGKRKLSRFLTDLKLPSFEKQNAMVLCDARGCIIWVVGYRIDNRYRVSNHTEQILKLSYERK